MSPLHLRLLAAALCVFSVICPAATAQNASSDSAGQANSSASSVETSQTGDLPDSPGTLWAKSQEPAGQQNASSPAGQQNASTASIIEDEAPASSQQNQKMQRPVGTAAAEAPKVTGITAAQPAGVAIAPAKQHRVRTIVLRVGAILGAGAAVGTVVALSAATPSKPPGAH